MHGANQGWWGAAPESMKAAGLLVDLAAISRRDIAYCAKMVSDCAKMVSEDQIDECDVLFPAPD
jgi:hypothetical protein